MATHIISPPRRWAQRAEPVLQTTNPTIPIDPSKVLAIARLERYVPFPFPHFPLTSFPTSPGTDDCSALPLSRLEVTLPALHPGPGLIYLAGAYAYPGIPLLEGCIGSARMAADAIVHERRSGLSDGDRAEESGEELEGIDWDAGRGSWIGRMMRWRRRKRGDDPTRYIHGLTARRARGK